MSFLRITAFVALLVAGTFAQSPTDPFPQPINANDVITVNFVEVVTLPDLGGQMPARPMLLVDEPGTRRLFVNDMPPTSSRTAARTRTIRFCWSGQRRIPRPRPTMAVRHES